MQYLGKKLPEGFIPTGFNLPHGFTVRLEDSLGQKHLWDQLTEEVVKVNDMKV